MGSEVDAIEDTTPTGTDWRTRSVTRVTMLDALVAEPRERAELRSLTDVSEETFEHLLGDAEERGWIERFGNRYEATLVGELMATHLAALVETFDGASRDRASIAEFAERVGDLEASIDDVEHWQDDRDVRITRLERRIDEKADREDIECLQDTIEELTDDEHRRDSRQQAAETSRALEAIDERIDRIERELGDVRTATTDLEERNDRLRTELLEVRRVAKRADRNWIDRLSGK